MKQPVQPTRRPVRELRSIELVRIRGGATDAQQAQTIGTAADNGQTGFGG